MKNFIYEPLTSEEATAAARDLCGTRCRVTVARPMNGGLFNSTFYVETEEPSAKLVIRAAPTDKSKLFTYEKRMMSAEPRNQRLMKAAGVPTAEFLAYHERGEVIGREYCILEYLPSVAMSDKSLRGEELSHAYREAGRYLRLIHTIKGDFNGENRFGWLHPDGGYAFPTWRACIEYYLKNGADLSEEYGALDRGLCDKIRAVPDANADALDAVTESVMTHGDMWENNILLRKTDGVWEVAAIIDADRALFGDVWFEFANQWMMNGEFMKGYGAPVPQSPYDLVRRDIYVLCYGAFAAFAFTAQFEDEPYLEHWRRTITKLTDRLLNK